MRTRSVKFCWQALLAASFVQRSSFLNGKRARAEPYSKVAAGASDKTRTHWTCSLMYDQVNQRQKTHSTENALQSIS